MKLAGFRILVLSLFIGAGLVLGCCKKPDKQSNNNGTLLLKFHITGGGQPFALNKTITNTSGQRYSCNLFAFYTSDVTLTGTNSQSLAPILLVSAYPNDIINDPSQVDTTFVFSVPAGTYTGLRFGIGPDAQQNQQGGSVYAYASYPANSPLGNNYAVGNVNHYYWGPIPGYLFFTAQGNYDSSKNNNGTLGQLFQYHCGTDSDYNIKTFTSPIQITANGTTTFTINLETNDIFNSPNTINLKDSADESTATSDNPILAKQLLQNLAAALKTN